MAYQHEVIVHSRDLRLTLIVKQPVYQVILSRHL